jgi:hypothetical protein
MHCVHDDDGIETLSSDRADRRRGTVPSGDFAVHPLSPSSVREAINPERSSRTLSNQDDILAIQYGSGKGLHALSWWLLQFAGIQPSLMTPEEREQPSILSANDYQSTRVWQQR